MAFLFILFSYFDLKSLNYKSETTFFKRTGKSFVSRKVNLKGHGNEADFLGVLQKLVPHRSLALPFEPFRFWLRIRGDIRNRKTTTSLSESGSR
jgi:hypothetical protein